MTSLTVSSGDTYSIETFGALHVMRGATWVRLRHREQRVVALVALRGSATRSSVAGVLWPEATEARARTSVRSTVWSLSKVTPGLILSEGDDLSITPTARLDVTTFMEQSQLVLSGADLSAEHLAALSARLLPGGPWSLPLLNRWTEDWCVIDRARVDHLRLAMLDQLCLTSLHLGDPHRAEMLARTAVEEDPLRESTRRRLIEVHLSVGDTAAAMAEFDAFRTMLHADLGLEPTSLMMNLMRELSHPRRSPQALPPRTARSTRRSRGLRSIDRLQRIPRPLAAPSGTATSTP